MNLDQYLKKNFDVDVVPVEVTTDNISSGTAADGTVLTADGSGGTAWESIPGINSGEAAAGDVLTADGSGGATWETPTGGGGEIIYEITGTVTNNPEFGYVFSNVIVVTNTAEGTAEGIVMGELTAQQQDSVRSGFYT